MIVEGGREIGPMSDEREEEEEEICFVNILQQIQKYQFLEQK